MRKKSTYLTILGLLVLVGIIGFAAHIKPIVTIYKSVFDLMTSVYVIVPALISGFVFTGNKQYWLINIVAGFATAVAIIFFITHQKFDLYLLSMYALAFLAIVYLLNLVRVLFTK